MSTMVLRMLQKDVKGLLFSGLQSCILKNVRYDVLFWRRLHDSGDSFGQTGLTVYYYKSLSTKGASKINAYIFCFNLCRLLGKNRLCTDGKDNQGLSKGQDSGKLMI